MILMVRHFLEELMEERERDGTSKGSWLSLQQLLGQQVKRQMTQVMPRLKSLRWLIELRSISVCKRSTLAKTYSNWRSKANLAHPKKQEKLR